MIIIRNKTDETNSQIKFCNQFNELNAANFVLQYRHVPVLLRLMCEDMCGGETMATNLELDDRLIRQAVKLGKHRTKKAAVTQALTDYVSHLKQEGVLDLFGKVDFDPAYDYKRQRTRV